MQTPFESFDEADVQAEISGLEAVHDQNVLRIDALQREMRAISMQLVRLAQEEEDAQALADQRWVDAERTKAEQEWFVKALQDEYEGLCATLREKEDSEEEIRRTHAGALSAEVEGDDLDAPLVAVLCSKEEHLRDLEDRHIDADDLLRRTAEELHDLQVEHDTIVKSASRFFAASQTEMQERELRREAVQQELKQLTAQKAELDSKRHHVRANKAQAEAYHAECVALNRKLEDDLQRIVAARDREAAGLDRLLVETMGEEGSPERLAKLDEAMMVLKGLGINVYTDYAFCGDAFSVWGDPEQALGGFHVAFAYLADYIEAVHGRQLRNTRWRFTSVHEARYDEVEALLSSLKQMVACYDVMGGQQKRRIECSLDIIHNASHLQRMAVENAQKFSEMVEAREVQKQEEAAERAERVKQTLERNRLRTSKKRAVTDLPPSERPHRSVSGVSAHTATTHASREKQQPRSASPRLAPIRN
eukprot:TRINITY_DN20532_c0_g1_i2.p1 TRINITY_DN20532_c0_g1~~TRINITY_DN20532_c0_g1_i2.p1  ORF type:complete len:544 (+),score=233.93 TRINITY_DN20532_c0_g1_i2:202-1632(+)